MRCLIARLPNPAVERTCAKSCACASTPLQGLMKRLALFILIVTPTLLHGGQITKCADKDGNVTYSDMPCAASSKSTASIKPESKPKTSESGNSYLPSPRINVPKSASYGAATHETAKLKAKYREIDEEYCREMSFIDVKDDYGKWDFFENSQEEKSRVKYSGCMKKQGYEVDE